MFKITEYAVECDEKIMQVLVENPGLRMRMIASLACMNPVKEVLPALHRLKNEGKIKSVTHRDMANMEIYDRWYINC